MTIDEIERLVRRLERSDVTAFTYADATSSLEVKLASRHATALPDTAPPAETEPPGEARVIRAPAIGLLRLRHPAADQDPALDAPRAVRAGEIVAYLEAGLLLRPVVAEADGLLGVPLQPDGSLVGYGTPLFRLL